MNPVQKALWFVESHFDREITLDDIAGMAGASRYHLTRAFAGAMGQPLMRYARGRRLTEAARMLSNGAPDILDVAIGAGYGSHEAFTRAFREQFGLTPETVRAQRHLHNLKLVEPIRMDEKLDVKLEPPRFETGRPLLIAGLGERYNCDGSGGIPSQWQRFMPYFGNIPGQVGRTAYGVSYNSDEAGNFDYLCGVEVADFSKLSPAMSRVRIPEQKYAVFSHRNHVSAIRSTWAAIWNKWFPESGLEVADAPDFERYGESFDPSTGTGEIEIWIPIKS
jgi:AraC family transcriptional regulator